MLYFGLGFLCGAAVIGITWWMIAGNRVICIREIAEGDGTTSVVGAVTRPDNSKARLWGSNEYRTEKRAEIANKSARG